MSLTSPTPPPSYVNDDEAVITVAGRCYKYTVVKGGALENYKTEDGGVETTTDSQQKTTTDTDQTSSSTPPDGTNEGGEVGVCTLLYSVPITCLGLTGFDIGVVMRRPNVYWIEDTGREEVGGGGRAKTVMEWCVKEGSVRSRIGKSGKGKGGGMGEGGGGGCGEE